MGRLDDGGAAVPGAGGEYRCMAAYPSSGRSLQLGRQNLHLFRLKNTRFDLIGGALYFLLVVSPYCFKGVDDPTLCCHMPVYLSS